MVSEIEKVQEVSEEFVQDQAQAAAEPVSVTDMVRNLRPIQVRQEPAGNGKRKIVAVPGRTYKILGFGTPSKTPQVLALQQIFATCLSAGKPELTEPEAFELVRVGTGVLTTRQDPVHIFRYYRKELKDAGTIEQKN